MPKKEQLPELLKEKKADVDKLSSYETMLIKRFDLLLELIAELKILINKGRDS